MPPRRAAPTSWHLGVFCALSALFAIACQMLWPVDSFDRKESAPSSLADANEDEDSSEELDSATKAETGDSSDARESSLSTGCGQGSSFEPQEWVLKNAAVLEGSSIVLTPEPGITQRGIAWCTKPIDLVNAWFLEFSADFGETDVPGADGIMLVITSAEVDAGFPDDCCFVGDRPTAAIEFDTFCNGGIDSLLYAGPCDEQTSADHVALVLGTVHDTNLPYVVLPNLEDGKTHRFAFSWTSADSGLPAQVLRSDDPESGEWSGVLSVRRSDIVDQGLQGQRRVYYGFRGSTSGWTYNRHVVSP